MYCFICHSCRREIIRLLFKTYNLIYAINLRCKWQSIITLKEINTMQCPGKTTERETERVYLIWAQSHSFIHSFIMYCCISKPYEHRWILTQLTLAKLWQIAIVSIPFDRIIFNLCCRRSTKLVICTLRIYRYIKMQSV